MTRPPYAPPSMEEVRALRPRRTAVSTFSGCGGSCVGTRRAGFRTLLASEFVEHARTVYHANLPGTPIDDRDIRQLSAADVLAATGLKTGELDLLEGSPPCQPFSTAGNREKGWGKERDYGDHKQRADDLFYDYARLVNDLQPRAFMAENVEGLIRGRVKGYFLRILDALRDAGYQVGARLVDSQWLEVPQARRRVFIVGVRSDLGVEPPFPAPLPYRYSIRDACPWITRMGRAINQREFAAGGRDVERTMVPATRPAPTLLTVTNMGAGHCEAEPRDPDTLTREEREDLAVCGFDRYAIGDEWDQLDPGEISQVYTSLVKADPDRPCHTITAAGGGIGAASVTHPYEKRKFTRLELRRLSGFPDDFKLPGTLEQGWERIGNCVPPPMAMHVARPIRDLLDRLDS